MRQSPTPGAERSKIVDLRVTGVEKRKGVTKHVEYVLKITWSNDRQYRIFRRYSMFFDLQAGLRQIFQEKYQITIPDLPASKFVSAGKTLFGGLTKKGCKYIEDFCQKIIQLPPTVSESEIVLRFFSEWGTDATYSADYVPDESSTVEANHVALQRSHSQPNDKAESAISSEQYKSIATFVGANRGEMSLKENEIVTVIEKNQAGWWFVMNDRGDQGFAPATFLEPLDPEVTTDAEEWNSNVEESERHWVTTIPYTAQSEDEVSYGMGEPVELLATSNFGWWRIRCKGRVGLTPAANLIPKGETDEPETPYASFQRKRTSTYASISGIYASIRKPPPRRESVKNKDAIAQKRRGKPQITSDIPEKTIVIVLDFRSAKQQVESMSGQPEGLITDLDRKGTLQYATVEILSKPPAPQSRGMTAPVLREDDAAIREMNRHEYATVVPKHLRIQNKGHLDDQRKNLHKGGDEARHGPSLVISLPKKCQNNSSTTSEEPSYATVEKEGPSSVATDRKDLTASDKHQYVNRLFADRDKSTNKEPEYYVANMCYTPPDDRIEDLELNRGDVVKLLSVDGTWYFVSTTSGKTQTSGWVPTSVLTPSPFKDRSHSSPDIMAHARVGDIAGSKMRLRSPLPAPRIDKLSQGKRKNSLDTLCPPDEPCPPLPGMPVVDTLERTQSLLAKEKLSKAYIAVCDYTNVTESCISFKKGEVGILLEVNEHGWWLMNIAGVEGWTPGEYWQTLERKATVEEMQCAPTAAPGKDFESEVWFHGKMARQECEYMMLQAADELEFIVRESPQRVASYVLSIKYSSKIRHFPVEVTASGKCVIGKHAFNSLAEVVTFYRNHALFYTQTREPVRLGDPFKKRQ